MRLDESFRYAVIEMGANHAGEIAYTSRYARANVSLITNVGPAHIEGFGSIAGIAAAKGEIIENLGAEGVAILNRDDEFYEFWRQLAGKRKTVSFGFSPSADVSATDIGTKLKEQSFETHFVLHASIGSIDIILQLAGEHNVKNALAAAAAVMQFGFDLPSIKQGLESVPPVTGRVQLLRGRKGSYVIDDTYNANPASLRAALTVLDENNDNWLILGAFSELGPDSQAIHNEMGKLIKSMPVKRLFAVGENAEKTVETFGSSGAFFNSQEQLINAVNQVLTGKETILVKGSRSQKMENVVAALVDNFRAA
jgi:UDP-N-acetylmuramoyl-tripeptide--D-alanyl-D-alanine ligase